MEQVTTAPRRWRHNPEILDLGHPDVFVGGVRHDAFAVLRRDYPVYWNEERSDLGPGFWNVTRHADVVAVSRDPATFSSAQGINITYEGGLDPKVVNALIGNMITMDPPLHNAYRKVALPFFTKSALERLEGRIRALAREIVGGALERGECDFMKDVAAPLPIAVLCEILGVPAEDHDRIFEWSNLLVGGLDPDLGGSRESVIPIYLQLFAYGQRLIEDRRRSPRGDLMTAMANATTEDGAPIPEDLLNGFFLLMVIAGNETTRNSMAGGMEALIEHPAEHRRLLADRSLLPTAVEEILRWVSPVLYMRRTATRATEIRGVPIAAGDKVVMWYPAANRDADLFLDPDRFDVGRDPNPHLAFGIGQHFCLGAQLARLQLRVMFAELLERMPRVELTGPVTRIRTNFLGAIKAMPVRVRSS
jgi:cholest-4-en-3-one 26-monooxygenase